MTQPARRRLGQPVDFAEGFAQAWRNERMAADLDRQTQALLAHTQDAMDPRTYGPAPRRRRSLGRIVGYVFLALVGLSVLGHLMGPPRGADAQPTPPPVSYTHTVPTTVTVTAEPTAPATTDAPLINPDATLDDSQVIDLRTGGESPAPPAPVDPETTVMVMPAPTTTGPDGDPAPVPSTTPQDVPSLAPPVLPSPQVAPVVADEAACRAEAKVIHDTHDYTGSDLQKACFGEEDDDRVGLALDYGMTVSEYTESEYEGYTPGQTSYFPPGDPRNDVIDAAFNAGADAEQVVAIVEILSR